MFFAILLSLIHYISESNEFRYKKKTMLFDNYIKNFMEDDYQTRDFKFTYVIVFFFVVVIATIFIVYFIFFLYKKCSKKDSEQIDNGNASPLLKANNDMYCEAIPPIVENPNYCQQQPQPYCQQQSYAIPTAVLCNTNRSNHATIKQSNAAAAISATLQYNAHATNQSSHSSLK